MESSQLITPSMAQLADAMKRHAETGLNRGKMSEMKLPYFDHARRVHDKTGTSLLFTRDIGHHSGGWFKNPDYERCYHLSISFWQLDGNGERLPRPFEHALAQVWCAAFYGPRTKYIWEEGPSQKLPNEVRHYRVFCDPKWKPIIPRGEVYTRDFIEKGWKSWSDQQYAKRAGLEG